MAYQTRERQRDTELQRRQRERKKVSLRSLRAKGHSDRTEKCTGRFNGLGEAEEGIGDLEAWAVGLSQAELQEEFQKAKVA